MADKRIKLEVIVTDKGTLKIVGGDLKKLNKEAKGTQVSLSNVSTAANKTKRNLEGVAQRSNRAGKDFSRMSQGMGGLVQAYATVAANVFALSSAFLVLRRTADLSSMIKSAENFSARFGVSVTRVTEQIQKATGGALSFGEALPIINKAISAGIPIDKMEKLAVAATKASQTFGGSATDALNRFISASQRGRVEIIQTLGIVIKTEKAYAEYGASIGKTAQELSAFDRQQAILNATIEASQSVFDKVNIDPNPFQQLLTTISDLKDEIGTFVTDFLTPMFNAFNQSTVAAGALIAVIVKAVGGRIFPELSKGITALAVAGRESTRVARESASRATRAAAKVQQELSKTTSDTSIKNIKKEEAAFRTSLGAKISAHKAFTETIFKQNGELNTATLTQQRAALARELAARKAGKGMQAIFKGVPTAEIQRMLNVYNQVGLSIEKANVAQDKLKQSAKETTNALKIGFAKTNAELAKFKAGLASLRSGLKSGFAQGFQIAEGKVVKSITAMTVAWRILIRDIAAGTAKSGSHLANFGRAVGRTAGVVVGAISGIASFALSAVTYISLLVFAWEKYGDVLKGVTPQQRAVEDAAESFTEGLEKANETLLDGIQLWGTDAPSSLKEFKDSFQFLGGAFESIAYEATNFNKEVIKQLNNLTVSQAIDRIKELKLEIETLSSVTLTKDLQAANQDFLGEDSLAPYVVAVHKAREATKEQREEIEALQGAILGLSKTSLDPLINQYSQTAEFAQKLGINISKIAGQDTKAFGELEKNIGGIAKAFSYAAQGLGSMESVLNTILIDLKDNPEELARVISEVVKYISSVSGELSSVNRQAAASLGQLQELGGNFDTFVRGLDKLKSQQSPFKEVFAFTLDAENALADLIETQKDASSVSLSQAFESGELKGDLKSIENLLGGQTTSIQDAYDKAKKLREEYQKQLEVQLVGAEKLKLLQLELGNIKDREIKSDKDRLDQVYDSTVQQATIARTTADLKDAELTAARNNLASLESTENVSQALLDIERIKIQVLEREIDALDEQEARLLKFTEYKLTDIQIQKDILENSKSQLSTLISAANINKGLIGTREDYLTLEQDIYEARKASLKIDEELIKANKATIKLKHGESEWGQRLLKLEDAKLLRLKQQTAQLDRQQESRIALQEEGRGTTIFSQDGLRLTAHFFRRAIEDEIPKLKSTFETLGIGFAKTVQETFDLAIDNLLEGARDFGKTVREGLKASLREVFGRALKDNITKALIDVSKEIKLFDKFFPKESEESAEKENTTTWRNNIEAYSKDQLRQLEIIARNTMPGGAPVQSPIPGAPQTTLIPGAPALPQSPAANPLSIYGMMKPKDDPNKKGDRLLEEINQSIKAPTELAEQNITKLNSAPNVLSGLGILGSVISASQGESKAAIVQALFAIAAQIIAAEQAKAAADKVSLITNATGGILPGGFKAMATGGVVNTPTLGLVGEGKNSEAVVPLPNNREIPVDLRGATGDTIKIEQNFDFRNADAGSIATLRSEAKLIEERTFNRVFAEINKGGQYAKISGRR